MTNRYHVDTSIRACLIGAIIEAKGNLVQVSKLTGLSRATCYRLIKKFKIDLKGFRQGSAGARLGSDN